MDLRAWGRGVTLMELRDAAAKTGQFYAPDPTEISGVDGRQHCDECQEVRAASGSAARAGMCVLLRVALLDGTVRWYRRGETIDFNVPVLPSPADDQEYCGVSARAGHGVGGPFLRVRGNSRRDAGG